MAFPVCLLHSAKLYAEQGSEVASFSRSPPHFTEQYRRASVMFSPQKVWLCVLPGPVLRRGASTSTGCQCAGRRSALGGMTGDIWDRPGRGGMPVKPESQSRGGFLWKVSNSSTWSSSLGGKNSTGMLSGASSGLSSC